MNLIGRVFILVLAFGLPASALDLVLETPKESEISFALSKSKQNLPANEATTLSVNEPFWVTMEGHVPVLVLTQPYTNGTIKITSPTISDVISVEFQKQVDTSLSELLQQFVEIQKLVSDKKISEASQLLRSLRTKYPKVHFLEFLHSSISILEGDIDEAKVHIQRGLAFHPDYLEAKELLDSLGEAR